MALDVREPECKYNWCLQHLVTDRVPLS